MVLADLLLRVSGGLAGVGTTRDPRLAIGLGLGHLGLAASPFPPRPTAVRLSGKLIGLRHSWLSREVAAFGAFPPSA